MSSSPPHQFHPILLTLLAPRTPVPPPSLHLRLTDENSPSSKRFDFFLQQIGTRTSSQKDSSISRLNALSLGRQGFPSREPWLSSPCRPGHASGVAPLAAEPINGVGVSLSARTSGACTGAVAAEPAASPMALVTARRTFC